MFVFAQTLPKPNIYIYISLIYRVRLKWKIRAPCLSHIRREKSHHPHGTVAVQKVTSGSGKSHQGRRITMPQPVSPIIRDLVKSSRSIAHSDDFEGHKLVQTNSRQLILGSSKQAASSRQAAGKQAGKKQRQASRQASNKRAASKQQPAFAPLKEWSHISFKNQRNTKKNINFFQAHGPKTMKSFNY